MSLEHFVMLKIRNAQKNLWDREVSSIRGNLSNKMMITQRIRIRKSTLIIKQGGGKKKQFILIAQCLVISVEGNLFITIIAIIDAGNDHQQILKLFTG